MKLRTTPPQEDCYVYTTPFNTKSQRHWEFIYNSMDFPIWLPNPLPYTNLKITANNCNGDSFVYFDDIPGNLLPQTETHHLIGVDSTGVWVMFKRFDYVYAGKQYLHFEFNFDGQIYNLYSEWLEHEPCTGEVATILPCIQSGLVTDINGDFVGTVPNPNVRVHFNSILNMYYSPQMYLRNATMVQTGDRYDFKKINNKILKSTLSKVRTLDSEWIQENAFTMLHSVFGFNKVWFEGFIFVPDTFETELQDVKALHQYHKINLTTYIEVNKVFLCTSNCYVAPPEH